MKNKKAPKRPFIETATIFLLLIGLLSTGCVETVTEDRQDFRGVEFCIVDSSDFDNTEIDASGDFELHALYSCPRSDWRFVASSCQVDQADEGNLTVTTQFEWYYERARFGGHVTTDNCGQDQVATCDMPELESDDYDLVHGEQEHQLTVPSEDNLDCERRLSRIQETKGR